MTILYVLISTDPFAGSSKSFMVLLKGVLHAGIKAVVVVPDKEGIYNTIKEMGVKVIVQNYKSCTWTDAKTLKHTLFYIPRQFGRLVVNFFAYRNLTKQLAEMNFDIIHSNSTITPLGRYIAQKRGIPHLYHIREYGDKDFGLRYFPTNRIFRKHLKEKRTYSACITSDIQKHHGLADITSSRVIYNGITENTTEGFLHQTDRSYFLYAGRIEPTKGLLKLIMAYCDYAKEISSPLPLKVAGEAIDDAYMQSIKDFISNNHLDKHIIFMGRVSNIPELYIAAKAIIIPSEHEGFGRCMPEAMSYGCISIGHDTGGTKEQFDNGLKYCGMEIGLRYTTKEELVTSMLKVHKMPEKELDLIRQNAFQCVSHLYTNKTYVDSVIDFYKYILKVS